MQSSTYRQNSALLPLRARAYQVVSLAAPALALLAVRWQSLRPWAAAAVSIHAASLYGTLRPCSALHGPIIRKLPTSQPNVWLTIDDGPDPEQTPHLLDMLAMRKLKATFFLIGHLAESHPKLVERIAGDGHQIGNHTFTHPQASFWCEGCDMIAREIDRTNDAIESITGARPSYFRAPVGHTPIFLHQVLQQRDLTLVGWSASGLDGVDSNLERIMHRYYSSIRPGSIIVMHDGRRDRNGYCTSIPLLSLLLEFLTRNKLHCVLPVGPNQG